MSITFKNSNFYGLNWHLSIPPVQDIPLAAKIPKYTLRAFVIYFYNIWQISDLFFNPFVNTVLFLISFFGQFFGTIQTLNVGLFLLSLSFFFFEK